VIRDPEVWRRVLDEVAGAVRALGGAIMGVMVSPIRGAEGNVEFLLHARLAPAAGTAAPPDVAADIAAVVARAAAAGGAGS
jgi:hypothetical protein